MSSDAAGPLGSWPASLLASVFFPHNSSLVVRIISGMFAALGIAFIFPVLALVVFDVGLWIWRLYAVNRNAYLRQQQLRQLRQRQLREDRRRQLLLLQQQVKQGQIRPPASDAPASR